MAQIVSQRFYKRAPIDMNKRLMHSKVGGDDDSGGRSAASKIGWGAQGPD